MKKRQRQEVHTRAIDDCQKEVRELQDKLVKLMALRYTKPSKNVREVKAIRQRIAVLLTCIREQKG